MAITTAGPLHSTLPRFGACIRAEAQTWHRSRIVVCRILLLGISQFHWFSRVGFWLLEFRGDGELIVRASAVLKRQGRENWLLEFSKRRIPALASARQGRCTGAAHGAART